MAITIKNEVAAQFRGRARTWKLSFVLTPIPLILWFYQSRPTCDLMFFPSQLAHSYAIAWLWIFLLIGLTNRGRVVCLFVMFMWALIWHSDLVQYRIPTNELRTVWRLKEMQKTIRSARQPMQEVKDAGSPALYKLGRLHGYVLEYSTEFDESGALRHFVLKARPECYCYTGQRSFMLEDAGPIHYTINDRSANHDDPVVNLE